AVAAGAAAPGLARAELGLAPREELLERDGPGAAAAAQLGLGEDRAPPDARGQPGGDGARRVPLAERQRHQRAAAVVPEAGLVADRGGAVAVQVRVGELAERAAADQADDRVVPNRLAG